MKSLKILISFIILFLSLLLVHTSYSAINMTISPIKYELESTTGATITREAKLTNYTDEVIYITTGKSDFVANGEDGVPRFIRKSELVFSQELSDWITIDTPSFNINPNETKIINFTINIPDNATPGGHYGAIFFKNGNSEQSNGANVGINVDYGILILLNIDGDINSEIEVGSPIISSGGGGVNHMDICNDTGGDKSGNYYDGKCLADNTTSNSGETTDPEESTIEYKNKDNCVVDLTSSNYDEKCINNFDEIISELTGNIEETDLNTDNENENKDDGFEIKIEIPIENKGNTHVKPTGTITLIDENGKIIKKVGKEVVTNDKGAIIGEKIVNYLPINDIGGNILPDTNRVYRSDWKGFPYFKYDENGEQVLNYWTPSEYYTKQNFNKKNFIMPWERISSITQNKKITAKFNINYLDENGDNVEYNSAKEFNVEYIEQYVGLNPYFFMGLGLLGLIFLFIFLIFRKKKKICINNKCKRKIDKDIKICPYCGENQDTKKTDNKKPIILVTKKQKLKTKKLKLKENIKTILIENKLKYAEDLTKLTPSEILKIKGIGAKAIDEIKKALKEEKMKLKK